MPRTRRPMRSTNWASPRRFSQVICSSVHECLDSDSLADRPTSSAKVFTWSCKSCSVAVITSSRSSSLTKRDCMRSSCRTRWGSPISVGSMTIPSNSPRVLKPSSSPFPHPLSTAPKPSPASWPFPSSTWSALQHTSSRAWRFPRVL